MKLFNWIIQIFDKSLPDQEIFADFKSGKTFRELIRKIFFYLQQRGDVRHGRTLLKSASLIFASLIQLVVNPKHDIDSHTRLTI